MEVTWPPHRKKIIFCPQNRFGCILIQFLTGRKHGQSLEASGHGFYCSFNREIKLTKTVQKLSKKFTVRPKWAAGGPTIAPPPEYATVRQCDLCFPVIPYNLTRDRRIDRRSAVRNASCYREGGVTRRGEVQFLRRLWIVE